MIASCFNGQENVKGIWFQWQGKLQDKEGQAATGTTDAPTKSVVVELGPLSWFW